MPRRKKVKSKAKAKPVAPPPPPLPPGVPSLFQGLDVIRAKVEKGVEVPSGLVDLKRGSDGRTESTYYGGADNPYEVIKVLKAWGLLEGFCKGNAIKYMIRAGKKGSALEDLKKALFYLDYYVKDVEKVEKKP